MDKNELNDEVEIDLSQLLKLLKKNIAYLLKMKRDFIKGI